jgi:hypothetical protein
MVVLLPRWLGRGHKHLACASVERPRELLPPNNDQDGRSPPTLVSSGAKASPCALRTREDKASSCLGLSAHSQVTGNDSSSAARRAKEDACATVISEGFNLPPISVPSSALRTDLQGPEINSKKHFRQAFPSILLSTKGKGLSWYDPKIKIARSDRSLSGAPDLRDGYCVYPGLKSLGPSARCETRHC